MKISQILNEQYLLEALDDKALFTRMFEITNNASQSSRKWGPQLGALANAITTRYPEIRGHGRMYRYIQVEGEDFIKCESNSDVLDMISTHALKKAQQMVSWGKDLSGVIKYANQTDTGLEVSAREEPFRKGRTSAKYIGVGIIYEQVGEYFDYMKFFDLVERIAPELYADTETPGYGGYVYRDRSRAQRGREYLTPVTEVLATHTNTIKVGAYVAKGLGRKITPAPKQDWKDTHYEDRKVFRADQFSMVKKVVQNSMEGQPPKAKDLKGRREFDDRSQYTPKRMGTMTSDKAWARAKQTDGDGSSEGLSRVVNKDPDLE